MGASDSFVRLEGVDKTYDGSVLVICGLDLEVRRGEFLTLLGPSGSGKTTILMMIAGFELPTRGLITLDGVDITRLPPHKRGLGVVFQNYALFPHMTVAENLAFPLQVRGIPKLDIRDRVRRALEMVRLPDLGDRMPSQLSGGQQQRVALARALVFEPLLVLMDEPLGALDKQLREHMQYEIKQLHDQLGGTVVYVTHDQGEALTMSDRIAVFNEGRIQQVGDPRAIYDYPDTAFVAQFIGETNRLEGIVRQLAGGIAAVVLDDGSTVLAQAGRGVAPGNRALVSLRPERLILGTTASTATNCFEGHILEVTYHGDHLRLRLAALGRDDFIVKTPVGTDGLTVGARALIGWDEGQGRALPL